MTAIQPQYWNINSKNGASENGWISYGFASTPERRNNMEYHFTSTINVHEVAHGLNNVVMFGIFDGHNGSNTAEYLKRWLFNNLSQHPQVFHDTKLAIMETYIQTNIEFLKVEPTNAGSTACTAILTNDKLFVANVGDSRAIMSRSGQVVALSVDHKPNRLDEQYRIGKMGGYVWQDQNGHWHVLAKLAKLSRAFGNRHLQPYIIAKPEIQELEIMGDVELLVLASNELWNVLPNERVVELARHFNNPEIAAKTLVMSALGRGSRDNVTCMVVRFNHGKSHS